MSRILLQQALDALTYQGAMGPTRRQRRVAAIEALKAELAKGEPCSKCHGLGYYDEGHENDDGSMSGGNYVDCEKCKPKPIGWATKAQLKNGAFLVGANRGSDCIGLVPLYLKEQP